MHRHDHDYFFLAIQGSTLSVTDVNNDFLFEFSPGKGDTLNLEKHGDFITGPGQTPLPWDLPTVHAAKNVGNQTYHEVLIELKGSKLGERVAQVHSPGGEL